uniref:Uncharacterized protein n=1 Tax=Eutreptiella gymnastica TaxID=73025 RepID=A0A7S4D4K3_9EUGL
MGRLAWGVTHLQMVSLPLGSSWSLSMAPKAKARPLLPVHASPFAGPHAVNSVQGRKPKGGGAALGRDGGCKEEEWQGPGRPENRQQILGACGYGGPMCGLFVD